MQGKCRYFVIIPQVTNKKRNQIIKKKHRDYEAIAYNPYPVIILLSVIQTYCLVVHLVLLLRTEYSTLPFLSIILSTNSFLSAVTMENPGSELQNTVP